MLAGGAGAWLVDADFLAGVVAAALQDELWTGPGRDDRSLPLQLTLRTGARLLRNVVCWLQVTKSCVFRGVGFTIANICFPQSAINFVWSTKSNYKYFTFCFVGTIMVSLPWFFLSRSGDFAVYLEFLDGSARRPPFCWRYRRLFLR